MRFKKLLINYHQLLSNSYVVLFMLSIFYILFSNFNLITFSLTILKVIFAVLVLLMLAVIFGQFIEVIELKHYYKLQLKNQNTINLLFGYKLFTSLSIFLIFILISDITTIQFNVNNIPGIFNSTNFLIMVIIISNVILRTIIIKIFNDKNSIFVNNRVASLNPFEISKIIRDTFSKDKLKPFSWEYRGCNTSK